MVLVYIRKSAERVMGSKPGSIPSWFVFRFGFCLKLLRGLPSVMDCGLSDESNSYLTGAFSVSVLPEQQRSEVGQTLSQNKHPSCYLFTDGQVEMRAWERSLG